MSVLILYGTDDLPASSTAISCADRPGKSLQPANCLHTRLIEALKPKIEEM